MEKKKNNNWRILIGNIGTLPSEDSGYGKIKIDKWKQLATKNCDINILSEINKDMQMIPERERLENITRGWWEGTL